MNNLEKMSLGILSTAFWSMPSNEWLQCQGFYSSGMLRCVAWLTDFNIWKEPSAFAFKAVDSCKTQYSCITQDFFKTSGPVNPNNTV